MNQEITIAKALKYKNRLVERIKNATSNFLNYNSYPEGEECPVNPKTEWESRGQMTDELTSLKVALETACQPSRSKIFELSEIKAAIKTLQGLNVKEGSFVDYGRGEEPIKWRAFMSHQQRDSLVMNLEKRLDSLQDEVDVFNHKTMISVEDKFGIL